MATYTYFELNADGSVPLFEFADFDSDADARVHASALLRSSPRRRSVEVWSEDRLVAEVAQDAR